MKAPDLKELEDEFLFDKKAALNFISEFHGEMKRGLNNEKSSLKMLSSFVSPPSGKESGEFIALDLGGTNFRVMEVKLGGNGSFTVASSSRYTIPKELMSGEGEKLFDFIAASLDSFLKDNGLPRTKKYGLGFTFSFPVRQTAIKKGELVVWTKGFSAAGVVGSDVVALLEQALNRQGIDCISVEALANDTVGTLMTCGYKEPRCDMGLIVGTGTNACYPEVRERDGVIINVEWGNFNRFKGNRYDKALDEASNNKGSQLFEKAVSGMYLGEIFRLVAGREGPYSISSEDMSKIVLDAKDGTAKKICKLISTRSARLAAAAVSSIVLWMDGELKKEHVVAVDGSLFEKYPRYKDGMGSFLKEILGKGSKNVRFDPTKDGSGIGAAIIAAVASQKRR